MKHSNLLKYGFIGVALLCSTAVVANNFEGVVSPVEATRQVDSYAEGKFYKLTSGAEGLMFMLSADVSDYTGIRVNDIRKLRDDLKETFISQASGQIGIEDPDEQDSAELLDFVWQTRTFNAVQPKLKGYDAEHLSLDTLWLVLNAWTTTNGEFDNDKFTTILDTDGNHVKFVSYLVSRELAAYNAANPTDEVGLLNKRAKTFNEDIAAMVNYVATTAADNEGSAVDQTAVDGFLAVVKDAVDNGYAVNTLTDFTAIHTVWQAAKDVNNDLIYGSNVVALTNNSQEVCGLFNNAEADEIVEFLTTFRSYIIAEMFKSVALDKTVMMNMLETMGIVKLVYVANEIGDKSALQEIFAAVSEFTAGHLKVFYKAHANELRMLDVVKLVNSIAIDNNVVYENKIFKKDAIVQFLREFPRPSELLAKDDDNMKYTWDVRFDTYLGAIRMPVTIGFYGDMKVVREILTFLADALQVNYYEGVISIKVNAPHALADLLLKLSNSKAIPNDLKYKLFRLANGSIEDMYNTISTELLADLISKLEGVDFKSLVGSLWSAEFINSAFDTTRFTEQRLDKIVDEFMKLVTSVDYVSFDKFARALENFIDISDSREEKLKDIYDKFMDLVARLDKKNINSEKLRKFIDPNDETYTNGRIVELIEKLGKKGDLYNKFINVVTRLYEALPLGYRDNKLMNTYQGNGVFAWNGSVNVNISKILTAMVPNGGETIAEGITALFDEIPQTLRLDLEFKAENIYKVEYVYDKDTRFVGVLPEGANIRTYSGVTTYRDLKVMWWRDAHFRIYNRMPGKDITLYGFYDFDITTSTNINKQYDEQIETISVETTGWNTYRYQWFKNGVLIPGAVKPTLDVLHAHDSGFYVCFVTRILDGYTKASAPIKVNITYNYTDLTAIEWDYVEPFDYDGEYHEVRIVPTTLPKNIEVLYTGVCASADAGDFEAGAVFVTTDPSMILVGETLSRCDWKINPQHITIGEDFEVDWIADEEYVYNGEVQGVTVDESSLPEYLAVDKIENNMAVNAGKYTATVTFKSVNNNYVIEGDLTQTYEWEIQKYTIENVDTDWDYDKPFDYDGYAWGVELEDFDAMFAYDIKYKNNVAVDAGKYRAEATLTLKDTDNIDVGDGAFITKVYTLDWEILPLEVYEEDFVLDYYNEFYYDGTEQSPDFTLYDFYDLFYGMTVFNAEVSGDLSATNAGEYMFHVKVSTISSNFVLIGQSEFDIEWVIYKGVIELPELAWDYTEPFTYDGTIKSVALDRSMLPYTVKSTVMGDFAAINAGYYQAQVFLSPADPDNWVIEGTQFYEVEWRIKPKTLTSMMFMFTPINQYVYDGKAKSPSILYMMIPEHTNIIYSGDLNKTDVGTYVTNAILVPENNNYTIMGTTTATITWSILPAEIDVSHVCWSYADNFSYNGGSHEVSVSLNSLPANVEIEYSGTFQATNVGTYTAYATLLPINNNYKLVGETSLALTWQVKKGTINLAGARWDYLTTVAYDGAEHTVGIAKSSYNSAIVAVSYENNVKTAIGKYTAKATFSVKNEFRDMYDLVGDKTMTLDWEIKDLLLDFADYMSAENNDKDQAFAAVKTSSVVPAGATLHVEAVDSKELNNVDWAKVFGADHSTSVFGYYNVYFVDASGAKVAFTGDVNTILSLTYSGGDNFKIVKVDGDTVTQLNSFRNGNYASAAVTSLGNFAIVNVSPTIMPTWALALFIGVGAFIVVDVVFIIILGNKEKDEETK